MYMKTKSFATRVPHGGEGERHSLPPSLIDMYRPHPARNRKLPMLRSKTARCSRKKRQDKLRIRYRHIAAARHIANTAGGISLAVQNNL